jgi:hypothetical protein
MRWSLRLIEFDFEIEHVTLSKIKHVDALSRHVGLVEETHLMSKEVITKDQKDFFVKSRYRTALQQTVNIFWIWVEFCIEE